jgi:hypothetical protein
VLSPTWTTDATRTVARAFNRIAWPAFAVVVITGIWNLLAIHVGDTSTAYQVTVSVKILVVAVSGVAAGAHAGARSKAPLAAWGALSGLTALGAFFLGIPLVSGS